VNIGNRTSVKSGDIRHIEHRLAIWHRYRFGGWSHSAAQRVNVACLLTLGSADKLLLFNPGPGEACMGGVRLISVRDTPSSCVRRQGVSDDGVSEVG